jgi:hypothetical protein
VRERADYQVDLAYDAEDVRRHLEAAAQLIEELAKVVDATPGLSTAELRQAWASARGSARRRGKRTNPGPTAR